MECEYCNWFTPFDEFDYKCLKKNKIIDQKYNYTNCKLNNPMNMKKLFQTIVTRWKAETPIVAKRVRAISLSISGASIAMATYYSSLPQGVIDIVPKQVFGYLITIGGICAFFAQLMQKQPEA